MIQRQSQDNSSASKKGILKQPSSPSTSQLQRESIVKLPVDAIYYINLKKSTIRKEKLLEHLKTIGLVDKHGNDAILQVASDGNFITHRVDNRLKQKHRKPKMSLSEIGCCASHREVWKKQIDQGLEYVLVLEDDARFDVEKLNELATNWSQLPEFELLHLGWYYWAGYKVQTIKQVEIEGLPNLWKGDGMWLTHAYILSLSGAKIYEERTRVQNNGLDGMTSVIQSDMLAYGFKPSVCSQESSDRKIRSTIHHTG
jgi:GR25 family glycosyltransferase involved in LPS biosynthesis